MENYRSIESPYNDFLERDIASTNSYQDPNAAFSNQKGGVSDHSVNEAGKNPANVIFTLEQIMNGEQIIFNATNIGSGVVSGLHLADLVIKNFIQSTVYTPGKSGFKLWGDTGDAEFNDVIVRGNILGIKKNYSDNTAGYFMGKDTDGIYKLYLGDSTTNLKWNGSTLSVTGSITATSGAIGGWTINATTITGGSLTLDSAGSIRNGKTTFSDSANAGFYIGTEGIYVGAASDASKLKYTIADGTFDFIGTVSSRSTVTIASTINAAGNVVTDLINARLDTSTATILTDFDFGSTNYAGAVLAGDVTWNTTTGAITGGSGVALYRKGIVGVASGVTTFAIDATTGNATFVGDVTATSGYFTTVTLGKTGTASGTLTLQILDGSGDTYIAAGKTDFTNVSAGFIMGLDDSDSNKAKLYLGDSTNYLNWDGVNLTIAGDVISIDTSTGEIQGNLSNIVELTAGETISGATTPVAVYMAKTQESTAIENSIIIGSPLGNSNVTTTAWIAQTFTTSSSVNYLKGVYVYLDDNVLNATATIYLYATDSGTGKPTGAALVTKTQVLNGSDKPMPYWIDLDYDCSVSTKYAIVIKASAATVHAPYVADATISNGTGWTSTDSGSTWSALSNDYEMCIMGCAKKTLGRVFSCDGNNAFKLGFNGFAITTGNAGDAITVQTDGVVSGFTGLTAGKKYYIDDSGVLSTTKGTYRCLVGFAISTTQLMIQKDLSLIFLEKYESLNTQIAQFRTNVWEPRVLFNLPETSVQAQFRFSDAASGSQSFGVRSFDSSDSVSYEINSAGDGTSVSPIIQLNKNRMFKTNCITGQVPTQSQMICAWIDPYYGD